MHFPYGTKIILMWGRHLHKGIVDCMCSGLNLELMHGTKIIHCQQRKVVTGLEGWNNSFYLPPLLNREILISIPLLRIMDLPSNSDRYHGRGHRHGRNPKICRLRLSTHPSTELKIKWLFEMFKTLDNTLIEYILATQPCLQRNGVHLEIVEENVEVLET